MISVKLLRIIFSSCSVISTALHRSAVSRRVPRFFLFERVKDVECNADISASRVYHEYFGMSYFFRDN